METDGDNAAFSCPGTTNTEDNVYEPGTSGLTKREYFAAKIMAGFCAEYLAHSEGVTLEKMATWAVSGADCLIEALNE